MLKSLRSAVVLGALGVGLLACTVGTGSTSTSSGASGSSPTEQGIVTGPTSGLKVIASIASVTLGDECGSGASLVASDCAEAPAAPSGGAAKRPGGGCGGTYCQQSNVQIAFNAGPGSASAKVEIVSVILVEATSGNLVDTLAPSKPQAWNGNGYSAWDQTIPPAGDLKASYDLSAPSWSKTGSVSYSTKYRLHVTLRIDGVEVTLLSTDLSREPAVAT